MNSDDTQFCTKCKWYMHLKHQGAHCYNPKVGLDVVGNPGECYPIRDNRPKCVGYEPYAVSFWKKILGRKS